MGYLKSKYKICCSHVIIFQNMNMIPEETRVMDSVSLGPICSNHDPRGYDGAPIGDQSFTYDYIGKIFKNLLLKNYWAKKAEIYMEAS